MRTIDSIAVPDVAFESAKEAEEYGKQHYDVNKDYRWFVSSVYLEDNK